MKEVKSQIEFDEAYKYGEREFNIVGFVVVLLGSSRAELRDSSSAVLRGSSSAVLWDSSSAVLLGSSSAVLRDSSRAELWGSSRAVLWDSSRAVLWESSSAVLRESSSAVLRESSRAVLWESSSAELRESSSAELRDFSVCYKLSESVKIKKGKSAVIIMPKYPSNIKDWCALKGIKIKNNRIKLWKCTNKNGYDFYTGKILYDTKKEIICPDWEEHYEKECGYALHLADSPQGALYFCRDKRKARLFEVSANINDCKCFGGSPDYPMKIRAKKCRKVKEYPIKDF